MAMGPSVMVFLCWWRILLFICSLFVETAAQSRANKMLQVFPPSCHFDRCPQFDMDAMTEWQDRQISCCASTSGLLYHCQEQEVGESYLPHLVFACLPNSTCRAGTYARLFEEFSPEGKFAWTECLPCDAEHYQSQEIPTYMHSYSHCREVRMICDRSHGKTTCYVGNSEEDDKCRCLYEEGFAPEPGGKNCECFGKNACCQCRQKLCPEGEELNRDYQCIQKSISQDFSKTQSPGVPKTEDNGIKDVPKPATETNTDYDLSHLRLIKEFIVKGNDIIYSHWSWITPTVFFVLIIGSGVCFVVQCIYDILRR